MTKQLVIVESPAKARTISRYLGKEYLVESSIGHVRDLPQSAKEIPAKMKKEPWARLGIDVANGFQPLYVIPEKKRQQVQKLKQLVKKVDHVYLATDEDREGESISWHLQQVLQPKVSVQRLVFHEITREAIENALKNPRQIDQRLVNAQEARRLLDRLYGYEISPLLWRVIGSARSAGRVQSVAVRLAVMRERERMRFLPAHWWDLVVDLWHQGQSFQAVLHSVDGKRLASGKDFSDATGQLKPQAKELLWLDEAQAQALAAQLQQACWQVQEIQEKPFSSKPQPPFTTSTLQQEASGRLHFSPRRTMQIAQRLYEQGHITYMRTDSTTLSQQALQAARKQISSLFGKEYLPDAPRSYPSKVKNAQEAHEAIRPSGSHMKHPSKLASSLEADEVKLYLLIWKRTIACQMKDAQGTRTSVQLQAKAAESAKAAEGAKAVMFQANGRTIHFLGWMRVMQEASQSSPPAKEDKDKDKDKDNLLPILRQGEEITPQAVHPRQHATQPSARYSEASLIKELEHQGIGRPSTYAAIVDTILQRGYVFKRSGVLTPTFTAFALVQLLEQHFSHLVDFNFTARMEDTLDSISRGEEDSLPYLKRFYHGSDTASDTNDSASSQPGLKEMLKAQIDAREICSLSLPHQQQEFVVRVGRWGAYLEDNQGRRVSLPLETAPDELTLQRAQELMQQRTEDTLLGKDPDSQKTVYLKSGRYGPYVQLGENDEEPKMKSLLSQQSPQAIVLEDALKLLFLPRELGVHPELAEPVLADLGRYGAYLRCGKETRSLPETELFSCDLKQAQELFAQPKARRRWGAAILQVLGKQGAADINLCSGRYGLYVTDGKLNASVPKGHASETVTLEQALEWLRLRAERAPARAARGKPPMKKISVKKKTVSKTPRTKRAANA